MSFTLVVDPLAEADLARARAEYDAIEKIRDTPRLFSLAADDVHFYISRRFPYVIYYRVEGDRVAVLAVVHKRQDQATWKRRL